MDLRPADYSDFSAILNKKKEFASSHTAILSALNIVYNFQALHRQGKSYQDINDGNFFINVNNGEVLICDNDNVAPDKESLGIGGKPGYMAPEIVIGQARPDTLTDNHSLAVVLFKLFMRHDPFMGKQYVESVCITEEAEKRLYGESPLFIFDKNNNANAPVPGAHPNPLKLWPRYPEYFQDNFCKAFGPALKDPAKRLTEQQWLNALVLFRGEIITCSCGEEHFVSKLASQQGIFQCANCKTLCSHPMRLEVKKLPVYLFPHNKLYECHTDRDSYDYKTVTGEVVQNKKDRSLWGIKNLSAQPWRCIAANNVKVIAPEEVAPIHEGMQIEFNPNTTGKIIKE